jgi:sugar phosphate isomerase/epimerase
VKLGVVASGLVRERTPEAMQPENLFAAAQRLGVQSLDLPSSGWEEPGWVERIGELQERTGIRVQLSFGDRYIEHGPDQPVERFAAFVERACTPLGVQVIGTVSPLHGGRWLREPPLEQQLERLAAALRRLAPIAEAGGVKLALENHADYRGYELARVFQEVNSPAVGARLDTANPYAVIEEPLAAAEALAPYTFATHVKDMIVEAEPGNRGIPPGGLLALRHCTLGEGHVDLPAIVALLAERSPLGRNLVLTLEVPAAALAASLEYARRAFAAFLD